MTPSERTSEIKTFLNQNLISAADAQPLNLLYLLPSTVQHHPPIIDSNVAYILQLCLESDHLIRQESGEREGNGRY